MIWKNHSKHIKRIIPFAVLIFLILIVYFTNVYQELTLENLRLKQADLKSFVKSHPIISPIAFVLFYILSVCLLIPDSTVLTLLSGFVFPMPLAIFYSVLSETVGALFLFAIFDGLFKELPFYREPRFLKKIRKKFLTHSPSYLLFLRFSHILPFWLTNISAAYLKVGRWNFIWTTFVGVIPLTYILVDAGHNLSKLFDQNKILSIGDIFDTQMKIALLVLGFLALVPILCKKFLKKRK